MAKGEGNGEGGGDVTRFYVFWIREVSRDRRGLSWILAERGAGGKTASVRV